MKLNLFVRISILLILSILLVNSSSNQVTASEPSYNLSLDITDAWYSDGEGDGKENDIFAIVSFQIDSEKYWDIINYNITLTRPSGGSDTYQVVVFTSEDNFSITNNFWNHATETGWYTVSISAQLSCSSTIVTDSLTFDPPGGDNSDPKSFST